MSKKSNFSSSHRKELIKLIKKAARTTSTWNVFNDFITVSALSLSNSSDSFHIANSEEVWNEREQRYLKTINKYDENTRPLFPQMFNELVSELQDASTSHYTDVLGDLFGDLGFNDKWKGQFFTPQHISDLMASFTINADTTETAIKERGFIIINEPCCGAGSLVIGAINAMRELNLNPSKQMLVVANDIDERCVLMCYRTAIENYKAHIYRTEILDDISGAFVNRLAEDSAMAKADLRNLFCKAPTWDNDLQAIIINGNRTHDPNYGRVYSLAHDILFNVIEKSTQDTRTLIYDAIRFFSDPDSDKHEKYIAAITSLAPKAYKPNKKKSRIFKALCDSLGVTDETAGSDFQKNYAKFADELSSKKINFKLYVSINPAHFLTMSNPKNDRRGDTLTSCHFLNSTDYTFNCGCTGYARDNVTFIVFTVADPDDPETLNNRKTTRQIFAYKPYNGLLLQSRLYNTSGGTYGAQEDSKIYRDLIQRELAELEGVPNLWKTYKYFNNEHCEIKTGEGFDGYPDWIYETLDAKLSIRYDHTHDYKPFSVGTYGLCISCADEIDEGLYCDNCKTWETCDCCNERCHETWLVHNHDGYEIYVCESCLENYACCEHCDEYFPYNDMVRIDEYNFVCQHCYEEDYACCDCCEKIDLFNNMYTAVDQYGDDTRICENCRDDYYLCDECNRYVHADDAIEATNSDGDKVYLCPECRNRDYQECDNCKGIFHEDLIEDDICPDCHVHQEEEKHLEVIA